MLRYLSGTPGHSQRQIIAASSRLCQELHGLASVLEEEGPESLVSLQDLLIVWAIAGDEAQQKLGS